MPSRERPRAVEGSRRSPLLSCRATTASSEGHRHAGCMQQPHNCISHPSNQMAYSLLESYDSHEQQGEAPPTVAAY